MLIISPIILSVIAATTLVSMSVTNRYPKLLAWLSGFITATAVLTWFIVLGDALTPVEQCYNYKTFKYDRPCKLVMREMEDTRKALSGIRHY